MPLRTIVAAVHLVLFVSKHLIDIVAQRIKFDVVLNTSELVMWGMIIWEQEIWCCHISLFFIRVACIKKHIV